MLILSLSLLLGILLTIIINIITIIVMLLVLLRLSSDNVQHGLQLSTLVGPVMIASMNAHGRVRDRPWPGPRSIKDAIMNTITDASMSGHGRVTDRRHGPVQIRVHDRPWMHP